MWHCTEAIVRGRGESSTKTSGASSGASYHVTQVAALLLGYIGIAFAYRYKALAGLFHLYSLHSWLGLVATAGENTNTRSSSAGRNGALKVEL
eukprot:jgi/Mesen1/5596/ME000282S04749